MFQPAFTLEDLKELRVSVVPRTTGISAAAGDSSTFECVIDVGVQKKVADEAELDGLLDLAEEIADHIRLKRLPDAPEAAGRNRPRTGGVERGPGAASRSRVS